MKKIIITSIVLLFAIAGTIIYRNLETEKIPALLERTGSISLSSEWINTQKAIEALRYKIRKNSKDERSRLHLALAFMQEARVTGEHPYYYPAAMELLDHVIQNSENDKELLFEAKVSKASVLLSLHQFSEALEVGKEALAMNDHSSLIYGVLCDAYVELGDYDHAVEMADKMVALRPDLRSYSRVSYLREIHGQLKGAIEAMEMAVKAGYPGLEQTCWTQYTLGIIYEKYGDLINAERQYQEILQVNPHYAFAKAGLGRIAAKNKNYQLALKELEEASKIIPEFSFRQDMAKIYKTMGKPDNARKEASDIVEMLREDEKAGHRSDLELAILYGEIMEDFDKAMTHAQKEMARRPDNIDVCRILSLIYYKKGDLETAKTFIEKANRTHSLDPSIMCLSGLIKYKSGDKSGGHEFIRKSLETDPYQSSILTTEAKTILAQSELSLK